jgi:hypothetical protein
MVDVFTEHRGTCVLYSEWTFCTPYLMIYSVTFSDKVYVGTSVMNMEHWAQSVRRKTGPLMAMMDFGTDCDDAPWNGLCNQRRYGELFPPTYDLKSIADVPLALYYGVYIHFFRRNT